MATIRAILDALEARRRLLDAHGWIDEVAIANAAERIAQSQDRLYAACSPLYGSRSLIRLAETAADQIARTMPPVSGAGSLRAVNVLDRLSETTAEQLARYASLAETAITLQQRIDLAFRELAAESPHVETEALRETFPLPPAIEAPEVQERWRRQVVQWFFETLPRLEGRLDIAGKLLALVLFIVSQRESGQMERRLMARVETTEARLKSRIESAETRVSPRTELAYTTRTCGVYDSPSVKARRLARLPARTALTVLACEGHWCRVEYYDRNADVHQQGWVYRPRIQVFTAER